LKQEQNSTTPHPHAYTLAREATSQTSSPLACVASLDVATYANMSSADHTVGDSALLNSIGEQPDQQPEQKPPFIQEMKTAKPAIHPFFDTQKR